MSSTERAPTDASPTEVRNTLSTTGTTFWPLRITPKSPHHGTWWLSVTIERRMHGPNSQSSSLHTIHATNLVTRGDWSNTPAHIRTHCRPEACGPFPGQDLKPLQYHQWDGDNHRSHTFGHGQLIGGAAMAVDGTHVHITRFVTLDTGGHAMNYEYSANSGITWTEALVKEGRDFKGTAVAASGSTGYFVYTEAHRRIEPVGLRSIMEAR